MSLSLTHTICIDFDILFFVRFHPPAARLVGIELNPGPNKKAQWREFFEYNQTMQRRLQERDNEREHREARAAAQEQIKAVKELRIQKEKEMDDKIEAMCSPPVVKFSMEQQMSWKQ